MAFDIKHPLIYLGLAVGAGIVTGMYFERDTETSAAATAEARSVVTAATALPVTGSAAVIEIERLQATLQAEIEARRALERQFEALQRKVAALDAAGLAPGTASDISETAELPGEGNAAEPGWFNQQALLDAGMDSSLAVELKVFFEQMEMERLFLRDRAAREDWDRQQLRSEFSLLESREEELKQRLGEDGYDAYLYASGQPNRVAVTSVLESAQAGQAGIRAGDQILRYDNQRIYDWRDLREATTSGDLSDTVAVEVEREGESMSFYLARGPLGVRMNSVSVAP